MGEETKKGLGTERIIFFGSRTNKKFNEDSNRDLIIVSKDFEEKKFRSRERGFYNYWDLNYPVDFLCYAPEEFNKLKNQITIVKEVVKREIEIN